MRGQGSGLNVYEEENRGWEMRRTDEVGSEVGRRGEMRRRYEVGGEEVRRGGR